MTVHKLVNIRWCIPCERYVYAKHAVCGEVHEKFYRPYPDEPYEYDVCDGPMVMSEPPVIPSEYWDTLFANEPSPEEVNEMNMYAEEI